MKIRLRLSPRADSGFTLFLVLVLLGVSLMVLAGALNWCSTNAVLIDRNNQFFSTTAAAEAATEKVLANMARDYQNGGESLVSANLDVYRRAVPTTNESPAWADYRFVNPLGSEDRSYVERIVAAAYTPLQSQYSGIYGLASTYRVISNTRYLRSTATIDTGVKQDVQLASIPLFQFAIFYSMDLEINPGPNMNITGRVHGNASIYTQPVNTLTFQSHVTAAGQLVPNKHPLDPSSRSLGSSQVNFAGEHDGGTSAITLPVGTNNSPDAVHAILEVPPDTESASSLMGKQRFYNKADLVLLVSNNTVVAKSGQSDSFSTIIPAAEWQLFLSTNVSFYNKREAKTIKASELDVSRLKSWSETNGSLKPVLGRDVRSVYVADLRSQSGSTQSGVRIKNGQTLPSLGLTVSSPNPIYVQGHYNAPAAHLGSTNTSQTKPAALVGDAITVLSSSWSDGNSTSNLSSRTAGNTTVNAAFMGGIVASDGTYYSGGVENFPRFLENWSSRTLTYNGSMVVMYYSRIAAAPWGGSDVYNPPSRNWTFDLNFLDATKLPPGTPEARVLVRGEWASIKAGTTE